MDDDTPFDDLIRRVRAGDEAMAAELVRRFEPAIRRAVRVRLHDAQLRRLLDAEDICQSVLASFFVRAALGQYEVSTPEQLLRLLATMARNKLLNQAHKHRAGRRDQRRDASGAPDRELPDRGSSPSELVAAGELLEKARQQLSAEEQRLAELRGEGCDWAAIAAEVGGSPEALRKQLARAVDRVSRRLGLEE